MQDLFLALDSLSRRCASELKSKPSALRVAKRVLLARISEGMDQLARLSFLEGVAHGEGGALKPGQWVRKGRAGLKDAQKYFHSLHPDWVATKNSGLFNAAVAGTQRVVGDEDTATRRYGRVAEDIVSDFLFGLSPISGARRKPVFYEVGLTLLSPAEVEGVHEGTTKPTTPGIAGAIAQKFQDRSREIVRKERESRGLEHRVMPRTEMVYERGAPDLNPLYLELRKHTSPVADKIRDILKQMVRKSGHKTAAEIFIEYLDYIKGSARIPSAKGGVEPENVIKDLSEITSKSKSQVSNSIKKMKNWLIENASKMGTLWMKLQKLVGGLEVLGEPGWTTRRARDEDETQEILADWLKIEDEFLAGDRTVNVGPLEITIGDFPAAPAGAYKHG